MKTFVIDNKSSQISIVLFHMKYSTYTASSKYRKNHQGFNKLINKLDYSYSSSTSNFLIDTSFDRHEFQ